MVKKLPLSCGATLARSVTALLCVTSPSTLMPASGKKGWRSTHHAPAASSMSANHHEREVRDDVHELDVEGRGDAVGHGYCAPPFGVQRGGGQHAQAQLFVGMPAARADIGTSEWLVMPGEVFISSRKGLRSLARIITSARPQPRQPSVRYAASVMRWISCSSSPRQAARALVLHVVGEVLVLVVVGALGRGDAHHRQRTRVEPLAQHGAGHFLAFDEFLAQHVGVVASRTA
jgi:hypothetical protein